MPYPYCFSVLLCFVICISTPTFAGPDDSLKHAYQVATTSEMRGNISYELAKIYYSSNPALSVNYARQGLEDVANNMVAAKVNNANLIGVYHSLRGGYDSANYFYTLALSAAKTLQDAALINKVSSNIGDLYSYKGEHARALKYQLSVLTFYEQANDKAGITRTKINIGNTYNLMHNTAKALQYYEQVYPDVKNQSTRLAGNLFNSLGSCYADLNQPLKAKEFFNKSLAIKRNMADTLGVITTLNNIASAANKENKKDEARALFEEAKILAIKIGDKKEERIINHNLAIMDEESGKVNEAATMYAKAYESAMAAGDVTMQRVALARLHGIYDSSKDFENAYYYLRKYEGLADTVQSINYQGEIADAETRYETQKALRSRDSLAFAERLQEGQKRRAIRDRKIAITVGGCMVAALSFIFLLVWRNEKIKNRNKEEQKANTALYEGEQKERIRIARDLHDGIGQMLAVVKMQLSMKLEGDEAIQKSRISSQQMVDKTIAEVRNISHNLLPEDLSFGMVKALESLCVKLADNNDMELHLHIDDSLRAIKFSQTFSLTLYRIVQEVLGNMIKHSDATEILIRLSQMEHKMVISLKDNGKGFNTAEIPNSQGIGWKNIFARVKLLEGNVIVQSEKIVGTSIEITLPKTT